MKKQYRNLLIIFTVVCISIIVIAAIVLSKRDEISSNGLNTEYQNIYKKYGINEYSVTNITNEQLAKIYLNDFKYYLFNEEEIAYSLLNEKYSKAKFNSFNKFKEYIEGIDTKNYEIKDYSVSGDKKFVEINTVNNQKIIFKINSIMDYEIYLDDYTVEIDVN